MRIVLLGPYYPFRGGISDTNQELFNSLIKKGHKVYIIDFKLTNHLLRPEDYDDASFNLSRKF